MLVLKEAFANEEEKSDQRGDSKSHKEDIDPEMNESLENAKMDGKDLLQEPQDEGEHFKFFMPSILNIY